MARITLRQLLDHAAENDYGLPAYNINNMEQGLSVMQAAQATRSPVILQASAGARKYAGEHFIKHLIAAAAEAYPHIPLVMHQDHGTSPDVCQRSIQLGFSSVMMDGSLHEDMKTPADYDYNVAVTAKVAEAAPARTAIAHVAVTVRAVRATEPTPPRVPATASRADVVAARAVVRAARTRRRPTRTDRSKQGASFGVHPVWHRATPRSATSRAAPAVSPATTERSPRRRMIRRHWPSAWTWLSTVFSVLRLAPFTARS